MQLRESSASRWFFGLFQSRPNSLDWKRMPSFCWGRRPGWAVTCTWEGVHNYLEPLPDNKIVKWPHHRDNKIVKWRRLIGGKESSRLISTNVDGLIASESSIDEPSIPGHNPPFMLSLCYSCLLVIPHPPWPWPTINNHWLVVVATSCDPWCKTHQCRNELK